MHSRGRAGGGPPCLAPFCASRHPPPGTRGLVSSPSTPRAQAAGVAPSLPPKSPSPRRSTGGGPYLGIDFCVLRCAAAQAAQSHQEQRQQSRPRRRLPAAGEAARPGRPSGRAPFAAHALRGQPGRERRTRGSPAPCPFTRLGNLRRSLAPRPAGARQTDSRSRSPPKPQRSPRQIPTPAEKRAGQIPARGAGPRGRGPARAASRRVPQPGRPGPGSRVQLQLPSLCLAQRSGRPVPRRPLRAQLSLSMPGAGRCPERAPPARGPCSSRARSGPGPPRNPGRRRREPVGAMSQPGSRSPTSPASSAQLGRSQPSSRRAVAAALKGPVLSLRAAAGGGRGLGGGVFGGSFLVAGAGCGAGQAALSLFPGGGNPPQPTSFTPMPAFGEWG